MFAKLDKLRRLYAATRTTVRQINDSENYNEQNTWIRHWGKDALEILGVQVSKTGYSPSSRKYIVVGNHIGYLDVPIILSELSSAFLGKEEVRSWPILGELLASCGSVYFKREDFYARKFVLNKLRKLLPDLKRSLTIFPEGTTTLYGTEWYSGAFRLAADTGIPIIPVAITYDPLRESAFIDNDGFIPHFWNLLGFEDITAKVHFFEPQLITEPKVQCESIRSMVVAKVDEMNKDLIY